MQDSVRVRLAIHSAKSSEEVGRILKAFFESLPPESRAMLQPGVLDISTYSDSVVGQKALNLARAELFAGPADERLPLMKEVSAVLSAAALRLAVIEIDSRSSDAA